MATIKSEVNVDAPVEEVWQILADFGGIQRFNPGVPRSIQTSDGPVGLGTTRHCDLTIPGASIEERITGWVDGHSYEVEIFSSKRTPPLNHARATLAVRPAERGTMASMQIDYRLKGGWLGSLMDVVMVRRQYEKTVDGVLAGLKHHAETGELVDGISDVKHLTVARG